MYNCNNEELTLVSDIKECYTNACLERSPIKNFINIWVSNN